MGFLDSFRKIFSSRDQEDRLSLSRKVQSSPNDPQARQKLGIFLMQQGEVIEGLDQLARAAVLYEKDGFTSKAIAVLRQMQKHDPRNNDFQKWLIRLLAQEGLSSDAQAELRKVASDPTRFTSDEQRLDFFRQTAEFLKKNPLPRLYICDILRGQKKLHEAVNELEKAVPQTRSSGMYAEFSERLRSVVSQAGNDIAVLEPCGFLWLAIGMQEEGLPILDRIAEATRNHVGGAMQAKRGTGSRCAANARCASRQASRAATTSAARSAACSARSASSSSSSARPSNRIRRRVKSRRMMPPRLRRRSWRAIACAASRFVLKIVSSKLRAPT